MFWGRSGLLSWMICTREPTSTWSGNARYVEKVKLADLWVTINVNSFNLVESLLLTEGERQGQGVYSASLGATLEQIACLRAPNSLSCLQHSQANRRPRPFFQ